MAPMKLPFRHKKCMTEEEKLPFTEYKLGKSKGKEWIQKLKNGNLIELISCKLNQTLFGKDTAITEIKSFAGEYAYLAMKAFANIVLDGVLYGNVTAAYFAQAGPEEYRLNFAHLNAKQARKHYKSCSILHQWISTKKSGCTVR